MVCLWCGCPLQGRSDKKFCDSGCRSMYHNARRVRREEAVRKVNRQLETNYRLLCGLSRNGVRCAAVEKLAGGGFRPEYCTGVRRRRSGGGFVYFCYDLAYTVNGTHLFLHAGRKEI